MERKNVKIFVLHEILRFFVIFNSDKYNQSCVFLHKFSPEDGGDEGRDEDEREEEEDEEEEEEERRVYSVEQEFDFKSFVARYLESEFNEFEPRLKSPKNRIKLSAG